MSVLLWQLISDSADSLLVDIWFDRSKQCRASGESHIYRVYRQADVWFVQLDSPGCSPQPAHCHDE